MQGLERAGGVGGGVGAGTALARRRPTVQGNGGSEGSRSGGGGGTKEALGDSRKVDTSGRCLDRGFQKKGMRWPMPTYPLNII